MTSVFHVTANVTVDTQIIIVWQNPDRGSVSKLELVVLEWVLCRAALMDPYPHHTHTIQTSLKI